MCRNESPNIFGTSVVIPSISWKFNKITMNLSYYVITGSWFRNETDTEVQLHDSHTSEMGFYWRNWPESCLWKRSPLSAKRKKNTFSKPKNKKNTWKSAIFFSAFNLPRIPLHPELSENTVSPPCEPRNLLWCELWMCVCATLHICNALIL